LRSVPCAPAAGFSTNTACAVASVARYSRS
jgi:hypothetical protein